MRRGGLQSSTASLRAATSEGVDTRSSVYCNWEPQIVPSWGTLGYDPASWNRPNTRMRLVGRDKLDEFCGAHADARSWIANWIADAEMASWQGPQDIKHSYTSASFLPDNLVIFNVKGNHYRLEVQVAYGTGVVVVRWVGTHAEYTKRVN